MRSLRHLSCHVSPDHIPIMGVLLRHCVFIHVLIHPCLFYVPDRHGGEHRVVVGKGIIAKEP